MITRRNLSDTICSKRCGNVRKHFVSEYCLRPLYPSDLTHADEQRLYALQHAIELLGQLIEPVVTPAQRDTLVEPPGIDRVGGIDQRVDTPEQVTSSSSTATAMASSASVAGKSGTGRVFRKDWRKGLGMDFPAAGVGAFQPIGRAPLRP